MHTRRANGTACGGIGGCNDSDGDQAAAASQCSTLRLDPETRGAMPRAGLRHHALAARLAVAARAVAPPSSAAAAAAARLKSRLKKLLEKIARLGPPQAKKNHERARRRRKKN